MLTLFYRNGHLLAVTVAIVLVAGGSALLTLPRLEDPRITNRNPLVLTPVPGGSAERVESLITDPLEEALREVAEIEDLESTSRAGISVIAVTLRDEIGPGENERVFSKIRDRLADVEGVLPPDAERPEVDDDRDPAAFTLIAAITVPDEAVEAGPPSLGIATRLGEELADRLRNVPGTELVRLYGEVDEEILIELDGSEAAKLGLSSRVIADLLRGADARVTAGTLRAEDRDVQLEVLGRFETLDRIRRVPLRDGASQAAVRLGDVASVRRSWTDPPTEIGISDGRRAVYVAARMRTGQQVGRWARQAEAAVDDVRREAGTNLGVSIVFDQSRYTNARLASLAGNLLLGAAVVMGVIFLTMGLRASAIVGSALPLVVAATLFGIVLTGGQLHQMSIFGMIIALGLLIDNAIVVTDEIRKRREAGHSPEEALGDTLRHLAAPLFASTLTTTVAFAPIVLLPGNAGDFVGYIGVSVILAIASSYALSVTVIAALAARFGRFSSHREKRRWWRHGVPGGAAARPATRWLARGLRAPVALILLAALPPIAGFAVQPHLGSQFFPPVDRDMFDLRVWLPRSASIERTRRTLAEMEAVIREDPDVERVHWLAGGSFPRVYYNLLMNRDRSPHYAQAVIDAASPAAVRRMVPELQRTLDRRFPGAQAVMKSFGQGPPVDADVAFRLYGPSIEQLQQLGDEVRRALQAHPDVLHTRTSLPRGEPKLWFDADEQEARLAGLGLRDLAGELRGRLDGVTGGSVVEAAVELPVRVRTAGDARGTLAGLASTGVPRGFASFAPLEAIGQLQLRPELAGVTRYNAVRCNIVEGYTREDTLPIDVTRDVQAALDDAGFRPPPGYRIELGGSLEQEQTAVGNLIQFAPVLGAILAAALILTFRSVKLALVLAAVGGLSVGLGLLSTFAIGFPVSFNTILGTLGLIGVAFNDSIVVIAAIRDDPDARGGDPDAVARAAMSCARHIVSTTLTTIGGFLPLLLLVGGEFWPSLAIVLAGGVTGATLLAMVFVPAAYRLLHRPAAATT